MKSPNEIAADSLRSELYARATFAKLIARPGDEFRAAIETDPRAQTEFMARHILDHYAERLQLIPPEDALQQLEAARLAAQNAEPHLRFRVEKELSTALRCLGRLAEAQEAADRAELLVAQTLAPLVHQGTVEYIRAVFCSEMKHYDEARRQADVAIATFESSGAHDRAHSVRLFVGWIHFIRGEYLAALPVYRYAARKASDRRSAVDLAFAYYGVAHCYRGLNDFPLAKRYFSKAAQIFRKSHTMIEAARSTRCAVRMDIRIRGDGAAVKMDEAKALFLELGLAGEVCRSTIAIMEELFQKDAKSDLLPYCHEIEDEARTFGVLPKIASALDRLAEAARRKSVTEELLQDTWDAFGLNGRNRVLSYTVVPIVAN